MNPRKFRKTPKRTHFLSPTSGNRRHVVKENTAQFHKAYCGASVRKGRWEDNATVKQCGRCARLAAGKSTSTRAMRAKQSRSAKVQKRQTDGSFEHGFVVGADEKSRFTGRTLALKALDGMLAKTTNLRRLIADMEKEFRNSPTDFFDRFVRPLLPKEQLLRLGSADRLPVRIVWEINNENDQGQGSVERSDPGPVGD